MAQENSRRPARRNMELLVRPLALALSLVVSFTGLAAVSTPAEADNGRFEPHTLDDVTRAPGFGEADADVLRLYRAFFARDADVDGALFWLRSLHEGRSIASIADGFAASQEFVDTYGSTTDDQFVETVYRNVLGRAPDADGATFWIGELAAGRSRGEVVSLIANAVEFETAHPLPKTPTVSIDQIVRSPQFDAADADVLRLYQAFLGRSPDVSGASFWLDELHRGRSIDSIADAFASSDEFAALTAAADGTGFIELVYANVLGRSPDDEGLEFWLEQLGMRSPASIVAEFARSPEFVSAHPFQMRGLETLVYSCGPGGDGQRQINGAVLDRLADRARATPLTDFDLPNAWLEPTAAVDVGLGLDAVMLPLLPIDPPHLLLRFGQACRPTQIAGPPDGGWLDRSLRRQRGSVPLGYGQSLECIAVDDVTGPTIGIIGVDGAPSVVDVFVDGSLLMQREVSAKSPAGWATVAWQAQRGLTVSDAVVALPVGGGPGDQFTVSIVADGEEASCGSARRVETLPEPQPEWRCSVALDGLVPRLDVLVPPYLAFEVIRDGQPTGLTRFNLFLGLDSGAQLGANHRYELVLRGDGQPARTMDCGSVAVPPDTDLNRIVAAEAVFFELPPGPYMYGSVVVVGPGTVSEPIDIAMTVSDDSNAGFPGWDLVAVDDGRQPIEPLLPVGHPGILPIQDVYPALRTAIEQGANVEMSFNDRGVPVVWTVNGFGIEIVCLETDTAPPDLRVDTAPWCMGAGNAFGTLVARP